MAIFEFKLNEKENIRNDQKKTIVKFFKSIKVEPKKFSSDTHEKDRSDLLMAVHHSDDLTEKAQQRFDTEKQELKDYYEKQLKAKEVIKCRECGHY